MSYDSRIDTHAHIHQVQRLLFDVIHDNSWRSMTHDQSKLQEPELSVFNEYTSKLAGTTYGSPAYEEFRKQMHPVLEHHYANNRHHPEHFANGIRDMTLLDIIEMLADWKAASLRHNDGNILKSVAQNQQRFGYSDELKQILMNTVAYLGY